MVRALCRLGLVVALAASGARTTAAQPAAAEGEGAEASDPDEAQKRACVEAFDGAQKLRSEQKLVAARAALLRCGQTDCPDVVRSKCVEWLPGVERALPSIVVAVKDRRGEDAVRAEVRIDGKIVARKLDGSAISVDPGPHTLRVDLPGDRPSVKRIVVQQGEQFRKVSVSFAQTVKREQSKAEAQLETLSRLALPETLPYEQGEAIPPGYEPDTRMRKGFIVGGSVTFGVMWLGSIFAAAGIGQQQVFDDVGQVVDSSNGARALFVPIVGPFIAIGTLVDPGPAGVVTLAIDGVCQTGGVAMLLAGIFAAEPVLVKQKRAEPVVAPGYLGLRARF